MSKLNNSQLISIICYLFSFLVFLLLTVEGIDALVQRGESWHGVLCFYSHIPVMTFLVSFFLSVRKRPLFWMYFIIFGAWGMILPNVVFEGAFQGFTIYFAAVPSFVGMTAGLLIRRLEFRKVKP